MPEKSALSLLANFLTPPVDWDLDEVKKVFPFSFNRDPKPLAQSIDAYGLARPLWGYVDSSGQKVIVAGGLRLAALSLLKWPKIPVQILRGPTVDGINPWLLGLNDNFNRPFNPAEKVRILSGLFLDWVAQPNPIQSLEALFPNSPIKIQPKAGQKAAQDFMADQKTFDQVPEFLRVFAQRLGIPARAEIIAKYLKAALLPESILQALAEERLDIDSADLIAKFGFTPQEIWDLLEIPRPTAQNHKIWLEWLQDIQRISGHSVIDVLKSAFVAEGPLKYQGPDDPKAWFTNFLRNIRFPNLTKLLCQREQLKRSLNLPQDITLTLDPTLEDAKNRLTINFSSLLKLKEALETLEKSLNNPAWSEIFHLKWPKKDFKKANLNDQI
ncbi:MAG: hypothetical protein LBI10_09675 [Deltaproteobacteria bacterium]|jgi:hypothetical protein|nr:hypothetical protein [Deltaproteobacteria bacterium]